MTRLSSTMGNIDIDTGRAAINLEECDINCP